VDSLLRVGGGREVDTEDDSGPAIGTTGARFGGAPRRRRTARRKSAEVDVPQDAPTGISAGASASGEGEIDTAAIPAVPVMPPSPLPRSGARQHGAPAADVTARSEPPPDPDGPLVGLTGARFGGARKRWKPSPTPAVDRPADPPPRPEPPPPPDAEEPAGSESAFVRPYVLTRGRTRSTFELSIETLVSAAAPAAPAGLTGVHQAVLGLCREPRSVAELAALAGVPLGVARVLVGDLAAAGVVAVHRAAGAAGPDLALMERVLSGLRKL
jgi:hypothetical protein